MASPSTEYELLPPPSKSGGDYELLPPPQASSSEYELLPPPKLPAGQEGEYELLPPPQTASLRPEAMGQVAQPEGGILGAAKSFIKGAAGGTMDLLAGIPKSAAYSLDVASGGGLPQYTAAKILGQEAPPIMPIATATESINRPIQQVVRDIKTGADLVAPTENTFVNRLSGAAGNMAPLIAASAVNPAVGTAAGFSQAMSNTSQDIQQARDNGQIVTPNQQALAELGTGVINAGDAVIPMKFGGMIAKKALGRGIGKVGAGLIGAGLTAPEEGLQEGLQQVGENVIAGQTYDPSRTTMQGVGEAAAIGGILGPVLGGVGAYHEATHPTPPPLPPRPLPRAQSLEYVAPQTAPEPPQATILPQTTQRPSPPPFVPPTVAGPRPPMPGAMPEGPLPQSKVPPPVLTKPDPLSKAGRDRRQRLLNQDPFSDEAYQANQEYYDAAEKLTVGQFVDESGERGAVVAPSAKEKGKWQVTYFDKRGFSGDSTFATRGEANRSVVSDGMLPAETDVLTSLSKTEEFRRGNELTRVVAYINETHGIDKDAHPKIMKAYEEGGLTAAKTVRDTILATPKGDANVAAQSERPGQPISENRPAQSDRAGKGTGNDVPGVQRQDVGTTDTAPDGNQAVQDKQTAGDSSVGASVKEPTPEEPPPPVSVRPVREKGSPKNRPTYSVQSKDGKTIIATGVPTAGAAAKIASEHNSKLNRPARKPTSPEALGQQKAKAELDLREAVVKHMGVRELSDRSPLALQIERGEKPLGHYVSLERAISEAEDAPEGHPVKMALHNLRELEKNPRGTKIQSVNTNDVADGTRVVMNDKETVTIDKENMELKDGIRTELPEDGMTLYGKKVLPPVEGATEIGEFAPKEEVNPDATTPIVKNTNPVVDNRIAGFRKMADSLQKQIDEKRRPMTQNATPKRNREYRHRIVESDLIERTQRALRAIADARENGTLPPELRDVKSKSQVIELVRKEMKHSGGYYDAAFETDEYRDKSPAGKALQEMIENKSPEQKQRDAERAKQTKIRDLEDKVRFSNIPGFFPTPKPLIDRMIESADIQPGMKVLEPSAGKGDIADAMREQGATVDTAEKYQVLQDILKAKGHNVVSEDFLQHTGQYDRIVMNPPFERGQDIDHVQHAWEQLKPGGKLVAIMSEGAFSRSDRKASEFRTWLNERNGTSEKIDNGAFSGAESFRQTGVATRMVEVWKPSRKAVETREEKPFYTPTVTQSDKGMFGQDVTKPAGIGEQQGMFHEPVDIPLPKREKNAKFKDEDTPKMFGGSGNADAIASRTTAAPAPRLTQRKSATVTALPSELKPVAQPELFQFAKDLMEGRHPEVVKNMHNYGEFHHINHMPSSARIVLNAKELGPDPMQAVATLSHEIGHLVDFLPDATLKRGNLLGRLATLSRYLKNTLPGLEVTNKEIRGELWELSKWWRPVDEATAPAEHMKYRKSGKEIYADAISVLLTSPGDLKDRAPKFFKSFLDLLDNKPAVRDRYFELMHELNGDTQELARTRQANIVGMFGTSQEQWDAAYARSMESKQTLVNSMFQTLVDKSAPLLRAEKKALKGLNPWDEQRAAKHAMEEFAMRSVEYANFADDVKRTVEEPLRKAGVDMDTAGSLMFLQRIAEGDRGGAGEAAQNKLMELTETDSPQAAMELVKKWQSEGMMGPAMEELEAIMDQAMSGKLNPLGYDPESARQQIEGIRKMIGETKYVAAVEGVDTLRKLHTKLVQRAVKEGVYNKETYEKTIKPNEEFYAPFAVAKHIGTQVKPGVYKQVGTYNPIVNTMHAMMMKSLSLIRATELNRAKRISRNALERYEPGAFTDLGMIDQNNRKPRVPEGKDLFIVLEDGKPHAYATDPYIAKMFQNHDIGGLSKFASIANTATYRVFHPLWIGLNPAFQVFNIPRDMLRTYVNAAALHGNESWAKDFASVFTDAFQIGKAYASPRNIRAAWNKARGNFDPLIRQLNNERALPPSHARATKSEILEADQFDRFLQQSGIWEAPESRSKILRMIGHLLEPIQTFGNFTEALPKVAMYDVATKAGLKGKERAYIVRNLAGTPNTTRRGHATEISNVALPYSNVVLQGYRADAEVALNPKTMAGRAMRAAMTSYIPKLAMAGAVAGLFGDELKELFAEISEYEKSKYIIIPTGWSTDEKGNRKAQYIRLPHNDTDRLPSAILWKMLNGEKMSGVSESLGIAMGELPSWNPWAQIAAKWGTFASGANPRDDFRGRDIVGKDEFAVGGTPAIKQMLYWTMGNFGAPGDIVRAVATMGSDEQGFPTTTSEKIIKMVPGLNRMVKVSARGEIEQQQKIIEAEDETNAEVRLALPRVAKVASSTLYRLNRLGDDNLKPADRNKHNRFKAWGREYRDAVKAMKEVQDLATSGKIDAAEKEKRWARISGILEKETRKMVGDGR